MLVEYIMMSSSKKSIRLEAFVQVTEISIGSLYGLGYGETTGVSGSIYSGL